MKPKTVRALLNAVQSRLVIETADGTTFHVPKAEYIVLNREGDVMAMFADGRKLRIVETGSIKTIRSENPPPKGSKQQG